MLIVTGVIFLQLVLFLALGTLMYKLMHSRIRLPIALEGLIYGLAFSAFILSLAFFTPVSFQYVRYGMLFLACIAFLITYKELYNLLVELFAKGSTIIIPVLILALVSAQKPLFFDHFLYHQQATLWFYHVGFVKGIANWDPNLAQGSLLHAWDSLWYFESIPILLNDSSILFSTIFLLYAWSNSHSYQKLLLVLGWGIGITLCHTSSAELVLIFAMPAIYVAVAKKKWWYAFIFFSVAVLVKVSALAFLPLLLFPVSFRSAGKLGALIGLGFVLILRNFWASGYPFFPFLHWTPVQVVWAIDPAFFEINNWAAFMSAYYLTDLIPKDPNHFNYLQKLSYLFFSGHAHSAFHWAWVFLLTYVSIKSFIKNEPYLRTASFSLILFMLLYFMYSPQPRIALPAFIFTLFIAGANSTFHLSAENRWIALTFIIFFSISAVLFLRVKMGKFNMGLVDNPFVYVFIPHSTFESQKTMLVQAENTAYYKPELWGEYCSESVWPCQSIFLHEWDSSYYTQPVLIGTTFREGISYVKLEKEGIDIKQFNSNRTGPFRYQELIYSQRLD